MPASKVSRPGSRPKRGVARWSGKKALVPGTSAIAAEQKRAYAQFFEHRDAELARVEASKNHPDRVCSKCGRKVVGVDAVPLCPRAHAMVTEKQPMPATVAAPAAPAAVAPVVAASAAKSEAPKASSATAFGE